MDRKLFYKAVSVVIVLSFLFSNIVTAEKISAIGKTVYDKETLAAGTDTQSAASALSAIGIAGGTAPAVECMPKGDNYEEWIRKAEQIRTEDLNIDMFRDYDYRNIGPAFKPEMAFLLGLAWADMAIAKAERTGIANRTVLIARDARKIEPGLVDALISALRYRGLNVVYMAADAPNYVTSYSWGVQQVKPLMK